MNAKYQRISQSKSLTRNIDLRGLLPLFMTSVRPNKLLKLRSEDFVIDLHANVYALFQLVVMNLSNSKITDSFFSYLQVYAIHSYSFFQIAYTAATWCLICFTVKFFISF